MRWRTPCRTSIAAGLVLSLSALAPVAVGADPFAVWAQPPGLVLRGETVRLRVITDARDGDAFVREGSTGAFARLGLETHDPGQLEVTVPPRFLRGSVLECYFVVRDPATGTSRTVPSTGAESPYRSWILDDPPTTRLGTHSFGHLREADAIVAQAPPGAGPGEVGIECPAEGRCAEPASFDVEADGTVWVADPANHRLLIWEADQASRASRSIPLDFTPLELAVAPDHSVFVMGVRPGVFVGIRLFALDRDGRPLWWSDLASDNLTTHLRFGPDGALYTVVEPSGPWTRVMDSDGAPLTVADQAANVRPDQPVSDGGRLVVSALWALPAGQLAPRDWRAAIATSGGNLRRVWRITSPNDLGLSIEAVPTVVASDPLLVFEVYRLADHVMEHVVVRLSASGGIRDQFSLGRGGYGGGDVITDVRVGADGQLYQLLTDPAWGLRIARYAVKGPAAPSVTPTPTTSPSAVPSAVPSATPSASPSLAASATPTGTSTPTPTPASQAPVSDSGSIDLRFALALGIAILIGVGLAARWGRGRPGRSSPSGR